MLDFLVPFYYNVFPFLVVLSILVFVHEMGHYLVARYYGVKVDVFSIGFGPEVFGWNDKNGTRWKVSYVPLGGYVRFSSDVNESSHPDFEQISHMSEEDKAHSLFHKPVGQRIAVSAAGPAANYLFALVVLSLLYIFVGARVPTHQAHIVALQEGSAAQKAGLLPQDIIARIGDKQIHAPSDVIEAVQDRPGETLSFNLIRDGQAKEMSVLVGSKDVRGKALGSLGVELGMATKMEKIPFYKAPVEAFGDVLAVSWDSLKSFGQMLSGQKSADGLSGPIGIAMFAGAAAQKDVLELVWLSVFLSISLGLINLFPIPMLDGGHILFYIIEAVRGKPLGEKSQEIAFRIGFGLVLGLILFSTWNDLSRLKIFQELKNFLG